MTLNQLHKKIGKMLAKDKNVGRRKVCVAKETFSSNLEDDGCTILDVTDIMLATFPLCDDDGGTATTKDGRERSSKTAVIVGWGYEPNPAPGKTPFSG